MESYEQIVSIIALTMGASWASGIIPDLFGRFHYLDDWVITKNLESNQRHFPIYRSFGLSPTEPVLEPPTTTNVAPQGDRLEQLEKLKHLFDSGTLTEAEFVDEKRKVLET